MEYKITEELANQVMSYLAQQPFIQVNKLLSELSNLQPITDIKSTKGAKPIEGRSGRYAHKADS